jgi:ATP-binding cassette, subfamily B, bacterial
MADVRRAYWVRVKAFFLDIVFVLTLAWEDHKRMVLGLGLTKTMAAVIPSIQVYIGKLLVDQLVDVLQNDNPHAWSQVFFFMGLELGLFLLTHLLASTTAVLEDILSEEFPLGILHRILTHTGTLDLSYFEDPAFRDKLEAVDREMTWRAKGLLPLVYGFGSEIISLLSFGLVLLHLGGMFVGILLGTTIPVIAIEFRQAIKTYQWQTGWSRWWRYAWYYRWVLAAYDYIQEFRIFRLHPLFIERFWTFGQHYLSAYRRHRLRMEQLHFLKNLFPHLLGYYGGFVLLLLRAWSRPITLGDVTMYMSAYRASQGTLAALVRTIGELYGSHLFIRDLREVLRYEPRLRIRPQARVIAADEPLTITFEEVSFRYRAEGPWVVSGISFTFEAGRRLAVVGENGSGKTTLVKLLLRFYDPTQGRIMVNGTDLREIDLVSYYARIGAIFQACAQYEGRIREQIGYGDLAHLEDVTAIQQAARLAGAEPFIEALPQRYETPLGKWELEEGTQKLSGGQWQRLALARACMNSQAALLILDEPTASLDPEAEERFFERLLREIHGKSILFISHRFSTVRRADHILYLTEGRITEQGTHEELMRHQGRYAEVFRLQARWYD